MGVIAITAEDTDGAYAITLAWKPSEGSIYRPVAFNEEMRRFEMGEPLGAGSNDVRMIRYRLDPGLLSHERVCFVGFEVLGPEGWKTVSAEAVKKANQDGVEILPYPEIDAQYEFSLTSVDGRKLESNDFLGKVVLLDCWATWCTPCMRKMPKLKELHQQLRDRGFEVVGVNFDRDMGKAKEAVDSLGIEWPQVHVASDAEIRDLWHGASTIRSLPRLLLIDRKGRLHWDSNKSGDLEKAVANLISGGRHGPD
jgi:thiol-disulfide isomerase/thioredoxin